MNSTLIKDTTKEQRIALIREWIPDDEIGDQCDIDLWEMYRDYIDGKREISEINAAFHEGFYEESDLNGETPGCGEGHPGNGFGRR